MRLDDETLLTAYLDGELDAAGRHRVQAALATSPALARRLGDLAEARDLVEGLSRPNAPVDLSASVVERLSRPVAPWAFRVGSARVVAPRWLAVASGLAAACLLLSFAPNRPRQRPDRDEIAALATPEPRPAPPDRLAAEPRPTPPPIQVAEAAPNVAPEPPRPHAGSLSPIEAEAEAERIRQQSRIDSLLARRDVRKIAVNVDVIRAEAVAEIRRSIDETPRKVPLSAQLTVTQGVLIDPKVPEGAIVFLAVLDDAERELFYSKLKDRFGDEVSAEAPAPAEEVVQLAELGHVRAFDGPSVPHLSIPPSDPRIAFRAGDPPLPRFDPRGSTLPDALTPPNRLARSPAGPVHRNRPRPAESDSKGTVIGDRPPESPLVVVWLIPRQGPGGG